MNLVPVGEVTSLLAAFKKIEGDSGIGRRDTGKVKQQLRSANPVDGWKKKFKNATDTASLRKKAKTFFQ